MSSQKIGPNSLASRARFCTGAVESSDSILPTTALVGGCGIGFSRFDAIVLLFPCLIRHCEQSEAIHRSAKKKEWIASSLTLLAMTDGCLPLPHPNRFLRHSISLALTSSGFSCWVQCPLPRTRYFSRS